MAMGLTHWERGRAFRPPLNPFENPPGPPISEFRMSVPDDEATPIESNIQGRGHGYTRGVSLPGRAPEHEDLI